MKTRKTISLLLALAAAGVAALVGANRRGVGSQPKNDVDRRSGGVPVASAHTPPRPTRKDLEPVRAAADARQGVLRIGAWNIEWLGKPSDRSGAGQGVAQSPTDLADYITASGVAVLAVEEVVAPEPGRPIRSREIEAAIGVVREKSGNAWEYVLFPGRASGDQLTGVLWNTAPVTAMTAAGKPWNQSSDSPWMLPIPKSRSAQRSALWNRPPHAMKFSAGDGRTDFVLIVLHMKADYQGDFAAHRAEEARALVAALPAVQKHFSDSDIVLLGDTNCVGEHEPAIVAIESARFFDLNASHAPTHWRGGCMDRVLVPNDQPEFAGHSFVVFSDPYLSQRGLKPQDYKRRFSDHYMVITTIDVGPDDD